MIAQNRIAAAIWRGVLTIIGIIGLVILLTGSGPIGLTLSYFTIQSNLFVVLLYIWLTVQTIGQIRREGMTGEVYHVKPALQLGVIFFVTITFLVYAILLSGRGAFSNSTIQLASVLAHYVVPIMALVDWLIFLPHGKIKYSAAVLWQINMAAYCVFIIIRAEIGPAFHSGSRYPYFFTDVDKLGWGTMAWLIPAIFACYIMLGCLLIGLDKLAVRITTKAPASSR